MISPDAGDPQFIEGLRAGRPDLIVSWFWTKQLPPAVLEVAPAIGVHPSLLPRHRGADPYFWAIASGDEITGVTAHVLDASYDTGPVLAQRTSPIDPAWNAWTLARKLDRPSIALLREVVAQYAAGKPPTPRPQDHNQATAAPEPDEDTLAIRWNQPASHVARLVRAASPWPGALTEIGPETVALTRVSPTADVPRALEPGEAWVRRDGSVVVRAADVGVELLEGRIDLEIGERRLDREAFGELLGGWHPVA
jgi:methionyl-tRNA formyltransferase